MVVETDIPPLLEWLLGPGWYNAARLHRLPLLIGVLVAVPGITWLVVTLRKGSQRAARNTCRVLAIGTVVAMFALLGLWLTDPDRIGLFSSSLITKGVQSLEVSLGTGWYDGALYGWMILVASLAFAVLVVGWLVAAVRHGPISAFRVVDEVLIAGLLDLAMISPRRVLALARLAVKESIRRRVVVAFALFVLILLFGGWFLDPASDHPARLYLSVVLTTISYLVLLLAWFLSALSLPADIKSKTLHTVVTKPVRASEIVLGRILGFTAMGTCLLAIMGVISYVFVVRGLRHTHELPDAGPQAAGQHQTTTVHGHSHRVLLGRLNPVHPAQDHTHDLTVRPTDEGTTYTLGPPKLPARVPIYGKIRFRNSSGADADKGINTGDEWTYRSFIEGDTLAAAIWSFDGITRENFPPNPDSEGLPLEMTIEVFRTTKGKTDDPKEIPGILGSLAVRKTSPKIMAAEEELRRLKRELERLKLPEEKPRRPLAEQPESQRRKIEEVRNSYRLRIGAIQTNLDQLRAAMPPAVDVKIFTAKDNVTDVQYIPWKLETPDGQELDLFEDLAPEGRLEVWLRCEEPTSYFGMARADVYFRARDAWFWLNLAKGYLGIWMQMVLVIGIGVTYSTCLSGPIALLATLGTLVGGVFRQFMSELGAGTVIGGGPIESLIRLLTQQNVVSEMDPGPRTRVAQMVDDVFEYGLSAVAAVLPEFGRFGFSDYVAYGFDVTPDLLGQCFFRALAFMVPVFVAGYLFLKMREVAK